MKHAFTSWLESAEGGGKELHNHEAKLWRGGMQVNKDFEHNVEFDARIQEVEHNLNGSKLTILVNIITLRDFFCFRINYRHYIT